MTRAVRLEEIEEFSPVGRLSRQAITENPIVLQGIRRLREGEEIEPFLRAILPDPTHTPHNSTEIADILTTHVTYGERPRLGAFVNKGRATATVTSRVVSHQVSRLRRVPGIDLMVLLAVGDIRDDIVADLTQAATDAGSDYLIIDSVDVARLFISHQKVCPRDGTPFADGKCLQCGTTADRPVELVYKVHEDLVYDIKTEQDCSVALAKRYAANVLTDPHYSRAAIKEVIKEATWKLRGSDFYRNEITKSYFGSQEADAVKLFVYLGLRDEQQNNWICRTQWNRPGLRRGTGWAPLGGTEWVGEIEIDWQPRERYEARHQLFEHGTKGEWGDKIDRVLPQMDALFDEAQSLFATYELGRLDRQALHQSMTELESRALRLSRDAGNQKVPPLECEDADSAFQSLATLLHNIFVPFASWGKGPWNQDQKEALARRYMGYYMEQRPLVQYELRKVR